MVHEAHFKKWTPEDPTVVVVAPPPPSQSPAMPLQTAQIKSATVVLKRKEQIWRKHSGSSITVFPDPDVTSHMKTQPHGAGVFLS